VTDNRYSDGDRLLPEIELLTAEASDDDLPDVLYQYTDINGLRGIYDGGQLWATSSMFLNDTTELKLGLAMTRDYLITILQRLQQAETPPVDMATDSVEVRQMLHAIEEFENYSDCFVACLTEQGDQLSQWRGYAPDGYCVGLATDKLRAALTEDQIIRRVRYSEQVSDSWVSDMAGVLSFFGTIAADSCRNDFAE